MLLGIDSAYWRGSRLAFLIQELLGYPFKVVASGKLPRKLLVFEITNKGVGSFAFENSIVNERAFPSRGVLHAIGLDEHRPGETHGTEFKWNADHFEPLDDREKEIERELMNEADRQIKEREPGKGYLTSEDWLKIEGWQEITDWDPLKESGQSWENYKRSHRVEIGGHRYELLYEVYPSKIRSSWPGGEKLSLRDLDAPTSGTAIKELSNISIDPETIPAKRLTALLGEK